MVEIRFYGELYEIVKVREYMIRISKDLTLYELIEILSRELGVEISSILLDENGRIKGRYAILINGSAVKDYDARSVKIKDDDVIAILPPAVGG
ncbi:MAG: MoaD/ThiS family protein [Sulfolobales archaeon]